MFQYTLKHQQSFFFQMYFSPNDNKYFVFFFTVRQINNSSNSSTHRTQAQQSLQYSLEEEKDPCAFRRVFSKKKKKLSRSPRARVRSMWQGVHTDTELETLWLSTAAGTAASLQ